MNRIAKYILFGFLVLLVLLVVVANVSIIFLKNDSKQYEYSLEGMVRNLNKQLPMRISEADMNIGFLANVRIDNKCVVWESVIDTSFSYQKQMHCNFFDLNKAENFDFDSKNMRLDLDTLLSKEMLMRHHSCMLMYYFLLVRTHSPNKFYEEILNRGFSQKWILKSPFSKRKIEFELENAEMKEMELFCRNNYDVAIHDFLAQYEKRQNDWLKIIASYNSDMNIELICTSSSFIYRYVLDDEDFINNMHFSVDMLKENVESAFNVVPLFYSAKEIAKVCNRDIIVRYVDSYQTDSLDVVVQL